MDMPARLSGVAVLPVLLAACATVPVNAPVDSRVAVPQTQALPTAVAATTGQIPGYYIVRRGDTLYSVAWQNGLNFRQLAEMNGIRPPYTIYVGQSLRTAPMTSIAPEPGPAPAAAPPPGQVAASVPEPAVIAPDIRQSQPEPVPAIPGPPARVAAPQPVAAPEPPLPAVVSGWVWPVRGPLLRGYTPEGNGKKGIDIGGRAGQPVMAAAAGRVVYSGSGLVGYGRLIIIKHNDNLLSAYGHNSELLVAEGDYVKAGQVIAKMGSSGTSSTRLYFEIRQDGKPVNPLRYLPRS